MKDIKQVIIGIVPRVEEAPRSEWNELLGSILKRINPSREAAGYKPLTPGALAKKLSVAGYKNTTAVRDLVKECEKASHFSKLLFHKLKQKS